MRRSAAANTVAVLVLAASTACSSAATADLQVGDCLKVGGPVDQPDADKAVCGSPGSNFKVVRTVEHTDQCPADVDSYYSTRSFGGSGTTVCMDVDWVIGGCMSVDPDNGRDPVRVDCADTSASNRQRATQILHNVANPDLCASGIGYPYDERQFTVCVDAVS
ncbi:MULTISPECIES: hypothetical protein [unclassified Mycobacterium]|uniref:LppU family putative lipoprotein n=1 Tax=unclassified Mycobacterium TaxID=2642494 RepID=UPI0029C71323|nr:MULTISPECIES: hypothetical protein [unclassified Mycobacterium]